MNHHLDQEVVVGFISEAKGYLPEIMLGLESFAADATQLRALKEALRFAHIITGAASMLSFMPISEAAYQLEVALETLCEEPLPLSQERLEALCQNVSELADLLDQSLAEIPSAASSTINRLSTDELSTNELLINRPSTDEAFIAEPSTSQSSTEETSATPATLDADEEKENDACPSTLEVDEEVLPEAHTAWDSLTPPEWAALEAEEEPLAALLNDTHFSVSLPDATETPTIGEVDLHDVAQELRASFGACPPLQPEFTLPNALLAGLPELQVTPAPPDITAAAATSEASLEATPAASLLPDVLEESTTTPVAEIAFDNLADQLATDLLPEAVASTPPSLAHGLQGDTFLITSEIQREKAEPVPVEVETQGAMNASEVEESRLPTCDATLPELLPLPNLSDLMAPTTSETSLVEVSLAAATIAAEHTPENDEVRASAEPMPAVEPAVEMIAAEAASLLPPLASPAHTDAMTAELMKTFLLEAEEHLRNMHTSLRVLYKNPHNRELLQEVRRSAHSLKGTASVVELDNIMQLAHRMEDVLDLMYCGAMPLTPERTLLLLQATDTLEDLSNGQTKEDEVQRLYVAFERLLTTHSAAAPETVTGSELTPSTAENDEEVGTIGPVELPAVFGELSAPEIPAPTALPDWSPALAETPAAEEPSATTAPRGAESAVAIATETPEEAGTESEPAETTIVCAVPAPVVEPTPTPVMAVPRVEPKASVPVHEPAAPTTTPDGAMTQATSQFVRVPIERLDEIVKLIGEMITTRTMFEQRLADFAHQVEELQIASTRLRRASSSLEAKHEACALGGGQLSFAPNNASPSVAHQAAAALAASGRVNTQGTNHAHGFDDLEFDRYTEFHLVARELVESSSDIQMLGRELNHLNSDFLSYLNRQGRVYSDLQDRLMRLRMVPLASLAPRLHRAVRTVGAQLGKEVELILEGETTALDTMALQAMTDPLLHLLRNAVAHGIETPETRAAKGKAPLGKITLRAFYEGSQVVIQLCDDGQGLDTNRIRNRALELALITSTEAEMMSERELWALIFTPGFSTAPTISEVSGRGVGMDVIHTAVQKLKGTITIDSQPQAGTTLTIRLPLTLAVTRALMAKANGQTFAIPLDVVTQILRLEMSKVERIEQEPMVRLGGKVYPLLMLSRLLNLRQPTDEVAARPPALLLSIDGKEVVVIVDQLLGGREVVIKTLGNHLRKIHGVMGATLMGDGEIVLILNMAELLRGTVRALHRRTPINSLASQPVAASTPATDETMPTPMNAPSLPQALKVMIVDDSPSVRRVSVNMIENIGWTSVQAQDGLDALEQLQASERPPDLILLDIEMPRMDGYQFLSSIRALPAYRNLPVIIVSSRSSEKHRQKAYDFGATEYLVKPYQEDNAVTLIRRLVRESRL
jgi:chemosensory pili system protein ChpA (sensor histidine kinase/response regulator)